MKYCPLCEKSYGDEAEICAVDRAALRSSGPKQDLLIGKMIKGRYQVLEKLGEGGMGTVYLAEQVAISRKVALKLLHPDYARDREFVRRFRQEAKLAASLNHRNVVTVFDFDQADDESLYIVMEYVDGRNLAEVVRGEPMELGRALRLAVQIAEGLEAAHRAGVIHRDVKPENVMVVGSREEIKLMDFGIARLRDAGGASRLTRSGTIMGTPAYMAPEQIEGGEVSEQTDIYAFGVMLYEILSGSVPFRAPTPGAVLIKHLQEAPASLRRLRKEVPASVDRVVIQALAKKPEDRQRSMEAMVDALKEVQLRIRSDKTATSAMTRQLSGLSAVLAQAGAWAKIGLFPNALRKLFERPGAPGVAHESAGHEAEIQTSVSGHREAQPEASFQSEPQAVSAEAESGRPELEAAQSAPQRATEPPATGVIRPTEIAFQASPEEKRPEVPGETPPSALHPEASREISATEVDRGTEIGISPPAEEAALEEEASVGRREMPEAYAPAMSGPPEETSKEGVCSREEKTIYESFSEPPELERAGTDQPGGMSKTVVSSPGDRISTTMVAETSEIQRPERQAPSWTVQGAVAAIVLLSAVGAFSYYALREEEPRPIVVAESKHPDAAPGVVDPASIAITESQAKQGLEIERKEAEEPPSSETREPVEQRVVEYAPESGKRPDTVERAGLSEAEKSPARQGEATKDSRPELASIDKNRTTSPGEAALPPSIPASRLVGISILPNRNELNVKERVLLTVKGKYSDGREDNIPGGVRWETSDPSVAAVNSRGELEGRAGGEAQITANYGGVTSSAVTVLVKEVEPPPAPENEKKSEGIQDLRRRLLR